MYACTCSLSPTGKGNTKDGKNTAQTKPNTLDNPTCASNEQQRSANIFPVTCGEKRDDESKGPSHQSTSHPTQRSSLHALNNAPHVAIQKDILVIPILFLVVFDEANHNPFLQSK